MKPLLNILPGFQQSPVGFERVLLRSLPAILFLGTLLILLPTLVIRILGNYTPILVSSHSLKLVDILTFATFILFLLAIFTISIGAFLVRLMKGPAYVADAYDMEDLEYP
jgi:hypothetical protein